MDQFFVLRRYRRHGVGEQAARFLFDRFAGRWEVREQPGNDGATAFWRRVIGQYTGDSFEERVFSDEKWRGPVQFLDSAHARLRK
jgi:predicted acetyltransferase